MGNEVSKSTHGQQQVDLDEKTSHDDEPSSQPVIPILKDEPPPPPPIVLLDWNTISVERQAQHYLFLMGLVLAYAELRDGVQEDRIAENCSLEMIYMLRKLVSSSPLETQDLMNLALIAAADNASDNNQEQDANNTTKEEEDENYYRLLFKKDPKTPSERPYPSDMFCEWQSWVVSFTEEEETITKQKRKHMWLLSEDVGVPTIMVHNQNKFTSKNHSFPWLYAICISQTLNNITIVLGGTEEQRGDGGGGRIFESYVLPSQQQQQQQQDDSTAGNNNVVVVVGIHALWGDVLVRGGMLDDITTRLVQLQEQKKQQDEKNNRTTTTPPYRISVVGYGEHGGALATVLGVFLASAAANKNNVGENNERKDPIQVWSFGAPPIRRIGNDAFQQAHLRLEQNNHLRHVGIRTCLPPGGGGVPMMLHDKDWYARQEFWRHVASAHETTKNHWDYLARLREIQQTTTFRELWPSLGKKHHRHSLSEYWRRLILLLKEQEQQHCFNSLEEWYQNAPERQAQDRVKRRRAILLWMLFVVLVLLCVFLLASSAAAALLPLWSNNNQNNAADKVDTPLDNPNFFDLSTKRSLLGTHHVPPPLVVEEDVATVAASHSAEEPKDDMIEEKEEAILTIHQQGVRQPTTKVPENRLLESSNDKEEGPSTDSSLDTKVEDRTTLDSSISAKDLDDRTSTDEQDSVSLSDVDQTDTAATAMDEEESKKVADTTTSAMADLTNSEFALFETSARTSPGSVDTSDSEETGLESRSATDEITLDSCSEELPKDSVVNVDYSSLEQEKDEASPAATIPDTLLLVNKWRGLRPPTRPLFNVGMTFRKRHASLINDSPALKQWVDSLVAARAIKRATQHVFDAWEARYWFAKYHSHHDALDAVKKLHGKLDGSDLPK